MDDELKEIIHDYDVSPEEAEKVRDLASKIGVANNDANWIR